MLQSKKKLEQDYVKIQLVHTSQLHRSVYFVSKFFKDNLDGNNRGDRNIATGKPFCNQGDLVQLEDAALALKYEGVSWN